MAISKPRPATVFADGAFPIARFVEKPDAATRQPNMSQSGRFFWNSRHFPAEGEHPARRDAASSSPRASTQSLRAVGEPEHRRPVRPARSRGVRRGREHLDRSWHHGEDRARSRRAGTDAMVRRRRLGCGLEARRQRTPAAMSLQGDVVAVDTRNSLAAQRRQGGGRGARSRRDGGDRRPRRGVRRAAGPRRGGQGACRPAQG